MRLAKGQSVDRYVVEDTLGSGGMAVVYRVRHEALGTEHALKVLQLPARSLMQRLLQEGRAQARLQHRNIVAVTDVIEVDGAPGLIMECVRGPSLAELLAEHQLSLRQIDGLARGLLLGMSVAHAQGLVHRDIKPANILVVADGTELVPKVADFGLAKVLDTEATAGQTRTGVGMGTPAYMSPEQTRDAKSVDQQADVFSLGATLFELATRQRAFDGTDIFDTWTRINQSDYPNPRDLRPELPERMVLAIEGALQVDRAKRFASARELLDCWLGDSHAPFQATEQDTRLPAIFDRMTSRLNGQSGGAEGAGATYDPSILDEDGRQPMPNAVAPLSLGLSRAPESGFAKCADGVCIAYQVLGEGQPVVIVPGFISHVELNWEAPFYRRVFERLASIGRVVMFDKRGTGMSDRHKGVGVLDDRVNDIQAVMEAVGFESAHIWGVSEGGPAILRFAARHPQRVRSLGLYGSFARAEWAPDYTVGVPSEQMEAAAQAIEELWGTGRAFGMYAQHAPDPDAARSFLARYERLAASPSTVGSILRQANAADARTDVANVRCPTLVVHCKNDPIVPAAIGRWVAENVADAEYIELDRDFHVSWLHSDQDLITDRAMEFIQRHAGA